MVLLLILVSFLDALVVLSAPLAFPDNAFPSITSRPVLTILGLSGVAMTISLVLGIVGLPVFEADTNYIFSYTLTAMNLVEHQMLNLEHFFRR